MLDLSAFLYFFYYIIALFKPESEGEVETEVE